jgi:hypothetical protein
LGKTICKTFFEVVELEPVIPPLQADHHGEGEHHLRRVDLVDVDDVDRQGDGDGLESILRKSFGQNLPKM